jgi:hypothetical protein
MICILLFYSIHLNSALQTAFPSVAQAYKLAVSFTLACTQNDSLVIIGLVLERCSALLCLATLRELHVSSALRSYAANVP